MMKLWRGHRQFFTQHTVREGKELQPSMDTMGAMPRSQHSICTDPLLGVSRLIGSVVHLKFAETFPQLISFLFFLLFPVHKKNKRKKEVISESAYSYNTFVKLLINLEILLQSLLSCKDVQSRSLIINYNNNNNYI